MNLQLISFNRNVAFVLSMSGIVFKHVNHVIQWNERIIDGNHLKRTYSLIFCISFIRLYLFVTNYPLILSKDITSTPLAMAALRTRRPIRPKPLIPTFGAILKLSHATTGYVDRRIGGKPKKMLIVMYLYGL